MSDPSDAASTPVKKSRSGCKILLLLLLLVGIGLGGLWWWHNRAITPVELSADETAVIEKKLEAIHPDLADSRPELGPGGSDVELDSPPTYEKGKSEITITERELNGLLHQQTKLGESVSFELVDGAVHARVAADLDQDVPIIGGKNLKARARFFAQTRDGVPELILDDLTVWGISVPNDWLGGLKGKNLLDEIFGDGPQLSGVKSIEIQRGRLTIKLKE